MNLVPKPVRSVLRVLYHRMSLLQRTASLWIKPVWQFRPGALAHYGRYFREWRTYSQMPGAEQLALKDAFPMLHDRTDTTPFDAHYFYQSVWAAQQIQASGVPQHVDVGSWVVYAGMLTAFTNVTFVDIRPLETNINRMRAVNGSLLALPFADNCVRSVSCLHVVEHIGLGRYGDPLDPYGTVKAIHELKRVLAPGGRLFFSTPVGQARVQFNAHRVHSPLQILEHFDGLRLVEFSVVDDRGTLVRDTQPEHYQNAYYACGMFEFTRDQ